MAKQNAGHSRLKKAVVSVLAAATVAFSGIGGAFSSTALGAENTASYDSASAVNYSSILSRAVDYGILAREFEQKTHMETTLATYKFTNHGSNNDVDLTDTGTAQFIFGKLGDNSTEIILGKVGSNTKTFNIEAPEEIFKNFDPQSSGDDRSRGSKIVRQDNFASIATIYPKVTAESVIESNIDRMIGNIAEKSALINQKAHSSDYKVDVNSVSTNDGVHFYLDLNDDKYENKVVYVNVSDNSVLKNAISNTGQFHIIKRSSTVVAMNIDTADAVKIDKYGVTVADQNGIKGEEILSDTTHSGDVSVHNKNVNREIAQKVIWNVPNSKNVFINISAGAFMIPRSDSEVDVSSSAGWLAAGGKVHNSGEWHYIYEGTSEDTNSDLEGQIHFAARKAFTDKYNGKNTIENTSLYAEKGKYIFHLYETNSAFSPSSYSEVFKYDSNGNKLQIINEATNKIKFPVLTFYTESNSCPDDKTEYLIENGSINKYYYVIKEENAGKTINGIYNSDGEVDLTLIVKNDNGVLKYNVTSYTYLDSSKNEASLYKKNSDIDMSGIEFSLGAFFNLDKPETLGETTSDIIEIRKENEAGKLVEGAVLMLSSNSASLSSASVQGAISFDRTENSIKWTSSNSSVYLSGLADGTYTLSEVSAPIGYERARDITDIRVEGGVIKTSASENGNIVDAEKNKIVMLDKIETSTITSQTTTTETTTETTTANADTDSQKTTSKEAEKTAAESTTTATDTNTESTTAKSGSSNSEQPTTKPDSATEATTAKADSATEATSSSQNENSTNKSENTTLSETPTENTSEKIEVTSEKSKSQEVDATTQSTTKSENGTNTYNNNEVTTNAQNGKNENSTENTSETPNNSTPDKKSDETTEANTSETANNQSGSGNGSRSSSKGDISDKPNTDNSTTTDETTSGSSVSETSGSQTTKTEAKTETTTTKKSSSKSDENSSSGSDKKSNSSSGSSSSKASRSSSVGGSGGNSVSGSSSVSDGKSSSGSLSGRRSTTANNGDDSSSESSDGNTASAVAGESGINTPGTSSDEFPKNSSSDSTVNGAETSEGGNNTDSSLGDSSSTSHGGSSAQNEDSSENGSSSSNPQSASGSDGVSSDNGSLANKNADSSNGFYSASSTGSTYGAASYNAYSTANGGKAAGISGISTSITAYNGNPAAAGNDSNATGASATVTGNNSGSNLPQTGSSAGTDTLLGFGMFLMTVGTLLLTRNKKTVH